MVHFYIARKLGLGKYKLLCNNEWEQHPNYTSTPYVSMYGWNQPKDKRRYSTSLKETTCIECLKKLKEKKLKELDIIDKNLGCI